jgi:hypothetical protein
MKTFLFLVVIHWISDFLFQDEQWAINKSKNNKALLKHTFTYSGIFFVSICAWTNDFSTSLIFFVVTFILHTVTDYISSRIVAYKFNKGEYCSKIPNLGAFSIIGIDQVLHYFQLVITYHILFGFGVN